MSDALSLAFRRRKKEGGLAVIAEIKSRRYRGADLLRGRSPADIARAYYEAGATALSVVTSPWFGGRMKLLEEVASANFGLPILRKDLILTEKAIEVSKHAGASAVLLVLPLLGRQRLIAMLDAARKHGLEPFVEVATSQEIDEISEFYDGVIAINNADIKTNEVEGEDISRSIALIQRKDPRLWVSASRIGGVDDVRKLAAADFDGILIGTHLLLADDIQDETRRIVAAARTRDHATMSRPIVKICGVTTEQEAGYLSELGVDYFGLQVDIRSPFEITADRAKVLAARSRGNTRATLITSPKNPTELERLIRETGVAAIQSGVLTSAEHIRYLRGKFRRDELIIIQEISYRGAEFWKEEQIGEYLSAGADLILVDKIRKPTAEGPPYGTIPEEVLAGFRQRHFGQPILVAGGVSVENVQAVLTASGAVGIDVCSSVRRDGLIQPEMVSELLEKLRRCSVMPPHRRPSLNDYLKGADPGNQVVPYLTIGDPPDRFVDVANELLEAGALTLELGFPFAEPAEGATLLASHRRALKAGMNTQKAMELFKSIALSHPETPLVAVVQWLAIEAEHELERFLDGLYNANAAAVLCVGLPFWKLPEFAARVHDRGLQTVVASLPNASRKLRELALLYCSGCFYVSRARVTGSSQQLADYADFCNRVSNETSVPMIVGVGVKDEKDVAEICSTPATAAVGTSLVDHIAQGGSAREFVHKLISR